MSGWKLVPVAANQAMAEAGANKDRRLSVFKAADIYAAMLAAAPQPAPSASGVLDPDAVRAFLDKAVPGWTDAVVALEKIAHKARLWDDLMHAKQTTARDPEDAEWKRLVRSGRQMEAIKTLRRSHGYSLREAKECVESYIASHGRTES